METLPPSVSQRSKTFAIVTANIVRQMWNRLQENYPPSHYLTAAIGAPAPIITCSASWMDC